MPETRIVGNDGSITLPTGHVATIRTWSGDFNMVVSETTGYGDSFRQYRGGVLGGSGSASGVMKFDAASTSPGAVAMTVAGATLTLTVATACSYSGTALVSNVRISSDKTGDATIQFDFQFSGTITEAWDET